MTQYTKSWTQALNEVYNRNEGAIEEATGDKEAYQKFFQSALKKFGVSSPAELKGPKEKEFYDYVDKNWKGDNEKPEANEAVQEKMECPKCKGEGCEHCDGKGFHMKEDSMEEGYFKVKIPDMPPFFVEGGNANSIKMDMRTKVKPDVFKEITVDRVTRAEMVKKYKSMAKGEEEVSEAPSLDPAKQQKSSSLGKTISGFTSSIGKGMDAAKKKREMEKKKRDAETASGDADRIAKAKERKRQGDVVKKALAADDKKESTDLLSTIRNMMNEHCGECGAMDQVESRGYVKQKKGDKLDVGGSGNLGASLSGPAGKGDFMILKKAYKPGQDQFQMVVIDDKGVITKDWGSHPSLDGAKKFAKNRGYKEEVEIEEKFKKGKYTVRDGNTGKVIATYSSGEKASKEMHKLLDSGKYSELEVKMEEVEIDEKMDGRKKFSGAQAKKDNEARRAAQRKKLGILGPNEEVQEETISEKKYELYHKDFSSAMQHAYKQAKKQGFTVDPEHIDQKVAMGTKKPSSGKTNRYILGTNKNKNLHVQVTNLDNKRYELNMYMDSYDHEGGENLDEYLNPNKKKIREGEMGTSDQQHNALVATKARLEMKRALKSGKALPQKWWNKQAKLAGLAKEYLEQPWWKQSIRENSPTNPKVTEFPAMGTKPDFGKDIKKNAPPKTNKTKTGESK